MSDHSMADLLGQDTSKATRFAGVPDGLYERHLVFDHVIDSRQATRRERYEAVARALRDLLSQRWLQTQMAYERANPKRVYYLSMEFLIGRSLSNNITNLMVDPLVREALKKAGVEIAEIVEEEPDAGLGNGGLGRLAACFIDSMATLQIPAVGYGLRYEYGIFRQEIKDGFQAEGPDNWLRLADPWEVPRPSRGVEMRLASGVQILGGDIKVRIGQPTSILGVPYDRPVVGYGGKTINTLRLWGAGSPGFFDLHEFNSGDFIGAVHDKVAAEALTRVLYPDDSTANGKGLRFLQEYFLVACSLADILARFRRRNTNYRTLPDKVAIQLNDTHPAMAVAELMRILLDQVRSRLGGSVRHLTVRTLAYTNHTLLPEALEKWPIRTVRATAAASFRRSFMRVNRRFLDEVKQKLSRRRGPCAAYESRFEEGPRRPGAHGPSGHRRHVTRINGVAAHSLGSGARRGLVRGVRRDVSGSLQQQDQRRDAASLAAELANPPLAALITETIGDAWITDLDATAPQSTFPTPRTPPSVDQLPLRPSVPAKMTLLSTGSKRPGRAGTIVHPDTLFDSQIKRIHEYKRQLLNVLHCHRPLQSTA